MSSRCLGVSISVAALNVAAKNGLSVSCSAASASRIPGCDAASAMRSQGRSIAFGLRMPMAPIAPARSNVRASSRVERECAWRLPEIYWRATKAWAAWALFIA